MADSAELTTKGLRLEGLNKMAEGDRNYLISLFRTIPGFPAKNILFRDFVPVLADARAYALLINALAQALPVSLDDFDYIGGLESRGFLIGAPLALKLGKGFIPFRKAGKLPPPVLHQEYSLEYGSAALEIPADGAVITGTKIALVDDVLATGGTLAGARQLLESAGAEVVGAVVVLEVEGLGGREKFGNLPISVLNATTE